MRASWIVLGLVVALHARRADADADLAAMAAATCRDQPVATTDGPAAAIAAAARATLDAAQKSFDAAVREEAQATSDAAAHPDAQRKAAAETAARNGAAAKAQLDAATKAADSAAAAVLKVRLCKTSWSEHAGRNYPARYLEKKFDKDLCANLETLSSNDDKVTVQDLCRGTAPKSLTNFGTAAVNVVLGVGDLLQAEAKQEVLDYLLEQIARKFCDYKKGTFELAKWFPQTCGLLFPAPGGGDIDASVFNFGDLKAAFNKDLQALPGTAGQDIAAWIHKRWPNSDPYVAAAGALVLVAFDLAAHKKPGEIFEHLGTEADEHTKQVRCDFTSPDSATQKANQKACAALLLFQLARTAAKEYSFNDAPHLPVIIQDSLTAFCKVHGVEAKQDNGDCVIDAEHYQQWHDRLLALWDAAKQMIDLQRSMDSAARTALPGELSKRSAPEVAKALRAFVKSFSDILANLASGEDKQRIIDDGKAIDLGFDVYDALVTDDPAALRTGLLGLLKSPVLGGAISPPVAHAVTVVVSLGTAKDRAEVKDILADVVSPVGSYKAKYGADHVVITLNSFVGFFAGGEVRTNERSTAGTAIDAVRAYAPFKLAAPIGLDVTLASSRNSHIGVFLGVIDPLALDVSDSGGTLHADWTTLFTPGAYVRLGVNRWPFSLALGASYVPGRHPDEMCGPERCFDGAIQFGAFLSADVPLLTIH
jgi:hypothetical protein